MKKYVVLSCDSNKNYAFYLPITKLFWEKLGFEVLIILIGNEDNWRKSDFHKIILENLNIKNIFWIMEDIKYKSCTLAQISRIFACYLPVVKDDDFLITSDVDMVVLKDNLFKYDNFFSINTNKNYDKYSMCYLGGLVKTWKEILNIEENSFTTQCRDICRGNLYKILEKEDVENKKGKDLWCFDEDFISKKINEYGIEKINFKNRDFKKEIRIEKENNIFNYKTRDVVDIHLTKVKDKYNTDYFNLRMIFVLFLNDKLDFFDNYYKNIIPCF